MIKMFWLILTLLCLLWYIVVVFFVAFKGGREIKDMLRNLSNSDQS